MTKDTTEVWITWEDHRRSRELANALNAQYKPILFNAERPIRYPILIFKTFYFLVIKRPDVVYCQNPSIVLNSLLCLLKVIFGYVLIVDRHSNFKFYTKNKRQLKWRLFNFLSNYSMRKSDLTIVTNLFLKEHVDTNGGNGIVLQDKLPKLPLAKIIKLQSEINFVFISTFSDDEPIQEVIDAAKLAGNKSHLYITGSYKKYKNINNIISRKPDNVTLTGFLPESDYQSLIKSADVIIVITDQEHTLTCGAYEAVSLEKPMILGNTNTIKEYFSRGALYTSSDSQNLFDCMAKSIEQQALLQEETHLLKSELINKWNVRFQLLRETKDKLLSKKMK